MLSAPDGSLVPGYGNQRRDHSTYGSGLYGDHMTSDMVASRSHRTGQPQIQSRFTTTDYPDNKEKIAPRADTNSLWNKELKDIVSRCQLTHIIDQGVRYHPVGISSGENFQRLTTTR